MGKPQRILIVDDNQNLRIGLRSILTYHQEFEVGEARDALEAIDSVKKIHPDLVLMGLSMPRMDGITREIKKKWPWIKILVFTLHDTPEYMAAALKAGAEGFLLKDSSLTELIQSIKDILDGKQRPHQNIME